uniref:Cadherin domain-containing protein n=1 Tax=Capra hircus TaxID=9925 RepID=A0A8C2P1D5_CAPHI
MEASRKLVCKQRQVFFFFLFLHLALAGFEFRRYSVEEEAEGSSFVTNLAKDLGLGQGELFRRGARVISKGNKLYLQLDQESGDLLLNKKLDREELCGQTEPCALRFQVLLENPLEFFQAELQVIDINDHTPVFMDGDMLLKISENSLPGTTFPLKNAQDMDVGQNNVENYIISPNSYFRVLTRKRSDGRKYPELVLDKVLDREEEAELRLTLTAQDGGSPPRSGTAHVYIEVVDINDNAPEFEQPFYRVKIPEDSPKGFLVVKVSATDVDIGVNGEISYSFSQASEDISKTFEINAMTGEIRLKKQLDFEKTQSYEVSIEASDPGSLSGKCTVLVQVVDVNDNAPEVTMSAFTGQIPENLPETVVAVFSVSDLDSEENGKVSCSIQYDLPFLLKSSMENFYTLVTERPLDRETRAEYNITITVTDLGAPRLKTEHNITVVKDINDHSPVFNEREIILKIPENSPTGTAFPLSNALDLDVGSNNIQNYTISPNFHFRVITHNRSDGRKYPELVLDKELDREEEPEISLTLTALDGGSPPRYGTAQVRIEVVDINDNAPQFQQLLYEVHIPENSPVGSLVVTVSAIDVDSGLYGKISYTFFQPSEDISKTLEVNPETGEIRLRKQIDFETVLSYEVDVKATDGGGLSGKCTLLLQVVDVNDNPPEVTVSALTSSIPENSPEIAVAVFSVSDPDSGDNGKTTSSIQDDLPFLLKPSVKNFYTLVTDRTLDREERFSEAFLTRIPTSEIGFIVKVGITTFSPLMYLY